MSWSRNCRTLGLGFGAILLGAGTTWVAIERGGATLEAAPVEELIEGAEAAPESEGPGVKVAASGAKWEMPIVRNARVDYWIDFLKGRNYAKTRQWLERSGKYGPMIRAKLRERGMPEDLLYLAMIESGFSPRAYSRAHASGLWQFISETGRRYGLEVSSYVDERRDPVKATDAALDYLEDLYERFGSWYLAAAAYNTGEGRVERILRQRAGGRKGDDDLFWKIDQYLPRETRDYVPLMLAAAHIGKNPEKYGFHDLVYEQPLAYEEVRVPGSTPLRAVAEAAEVDYDDIRELNLHFVGGRTPPRRDVVVRLPEGRGKVFAANFMRMKLEGQLAAATTEHTVRRGETLSHIARRYGTTVRALQEANGGINPRRLRVGQVVRIPNGRAATPARVATASVASASSTPSWTVHRVRRGDSLWKISRRYGVTVDQIRAWNGIGGSRIVPGQELRIRT